MKPTSKDERRALMPECSKFIDDMRENFGDLVSIKAEENGQVVEWGQIESVVSFPALPMDLT